MSSLIKNMLFFFLNLHFCLLSYDEDSREGSFSKFVMFLFVMVGGENHLNLYIFNDKPNLFSYNILKAHIIIHSVIFVAIFSN